jgi:hypothetical protein
VDQLAAMCGAAGAWLVLDNTYEQFVYGGQHHCASAPHVLNVFSFSKVGAAGGGQQQQQQKKKKKKILALVFRSTPLRPPPPLRRLTA